MQQIMENFVSRELLKVYEKVNQLLIFLTRFSLKQDLQEGYLLEPNCKHFLKLFSYHPYYSKEILFFNNVKIIIYNKTIFFIFN